MLAAIFPALLDELRHEARPTGLVACADSRSVVSMEIFIEEKKLTPVRIGLKFLCPTKHGAPPVLIALKDPHQAM